METIKTDIIKNANIKIEKHITDYLKQCQKLEMSADGQLMGWCGDNAYLIHINVAINAYVDRLKVETIV